MNDAQSLKSDIQEEMIQENKVLLFHLGEEEFGVQILYVVNIIELQKITPVPKMPAFLKGVINLRGQVIPIMDLRLRFSMESRPFDDRTCIVIVAKGDMQLGLIVDTVAEVINIPEDHIQPPVSLDTHGKIDPFIQGLARVGEKVKIIIDLDCLLESVNQVP